jgi:cyanophycinase
VLATVASHEPEGYLERYQKSFADLGITNVVELYVDDRDQAMSEAKLKTLDGVDAVFFSGGDQLREISEEDGAEADPERKAEIQHADAFAVAFGKP